MSVKRLLVTGASGLIGKYVTEELNKGGLYDITAVISGRRAVDFPEGVHVERANLLVASEREELFKRWKPEICCHIAWGLGDENSPRNLEWCEASLHLLKLFSENGGKKFFFAGSCEEYGVRCGSIKKTETPEKPLYSLYGRAKLSFEQMARSYCSGCGIDFISGRYFAIYGPWAQSYDTVLPKAIRTMISGQEFVCKTPHNIWDYMYVKDCAKVTALLINKGDPGCYNVASGQPITMGEAFMTIAEVLGTEKLLRFCEVPEWEPIALTADISKLKRTIGYSHFTPFRQGIKETVDWWLGQTERRK